MKKVLIVLATLIAIIMFLNEGIIPDASAIGRNVSENDRSNGTIDRWNKTENLSSVWLSEGGNISEVNMSLKWQSFNWQGFWGVINETGIVLQDAQGQVFYNWTTGNISGQLFFTTFTIENWYNISNGTNPRVLHAQYNLSFANTTDLDSLRRTYNTTKYHEGYQIVIDNETIPIQLAPANNIYTNNTNITVGFERYSTFNSSMVWYNGTGTNYNGDSLREEGIPVFAALIQYNGSSFKNNGSMFDEASEWKRADYSILVPVNTSQSDLTDVYYVYAQIGDESVIN